MEWIFGPMATTPNSRCATNSTPGRRELAVFLAVYLLYDAARWTFAARLPVARAHARWVFHLERSLHIAIEGAVQRAFDAGATAFLLSNVYLAAQLIVLPAVLIWLYHRSPAIYRPLRNTVIVTWSIAVPIFAIYPVAPPRLVGIGIRDTVSHQGGVVLSGHSTIFYNPYAAVPSLHVGLAFAVGIAVGASLGRAWQTALALMWGPLVTLAVIATGNHFVFDAAAGVLVTGIAYILTTLTGRTTAGARVQVGRARRLLPAPARS